MEIAAQKIQSICLILVRPETIAAYSSVICLNIKISETQSEILILTGEELNILLCGKRNRGKWHPL